MKAPDELWTVARCLGDIAGQVVFVGGMIRELLVTDSAAGPARPTQDVDCVVGTSTLVEYHQLGARLRERGFSECMDEDAPLCRWVVQDVRVDIMPVDPAVFGFSNVWYPSGIEHAIEVKGPDGTVHIVDAVHFCATKIEAFLGRGENDLYHHDMEDFIALVDGRQELVEELGQAPDELRVFIGQAVAEWLGDSAFLEALAGHLPGDDASQARRPLLLERLGRIAALVGQPAAATGQGRAPRPRVQTHSPGPRPSGPAQLPSAVRLLSSNLQSVAYDEQARALTITFHGGRVYAYSDVPPNVYRGLLGATSKGRYFHQWIRARYPYQRVR